MKKIFAGAAALAATLLAVPAGSSNAQDAADVTLMHGIPGATVDVVVDGAVVIPNFEPGTMQDISSFAGQTLTNVEVRAAGTDTVVIGPVAELRRPRLRQLDGRRPPHADGTPTLTPFENDTSALAAGQGRLIVRHTAAAPAVDIVLADGPPVHEPVQPERASADLPAGEIAGAKIAPTGGDPIADVPTVELVAGTEPDRLRRRQPRRRDVHVLHPDRGPGVGRFVGRRRHPCPDRRQHRWRARCHVEQLSGIVRRCGRPVRPRRWSHGAPPPHGRELISSRSAHRPH